jgi:hypothetical protein
LHPYILARDIELSTGIAAKFHLRVGTHRAL